MPSRTRKPDPDPTLDPILAEIDAEFGRPSRRKSPPVKDKNALRKQLNKEFHARLSSIGGADPNSIARSWRDIPGLRPISRLSYIILEHCRTCDGTVQYIGNEFTIFHSPRTSTRIFSPELLTVDELGFDLPLEIEHREHSVERCAPCTLFEHRVNQLIEASLSTETERQLLLPFATTP